MKDVAAFQDWLTRMHNNTEVDSMTNHQEQVDIAQRLWDAMGRYDIPNEYAVSRLCELVLQAAAWRKDANLRIVRDGVADAEAEADGGWEDDGLDHESDADALRRKMSQWANSVHALQSEELSSIGIDDMGDLRDNVPAFRAWMAEFWNVLYHGAEG